MKLLYLSILSFLFVSSCALAFPEIKNENKGQVASYSVEKKFIPVPVLDSYATFPLLSSQSAFAVDLDSGVTLYEKDPDKKLLPASTTKIVTALVALDYYPLNQIIQIGQLDIEGQKMRLVSGETITVEDLLYGLLIYSANDAAEALAEGYSGGREAFIGAMNQKARELHLENSSFTNPTGLDSDGHYSTAKDLVRVASVAMQNPTFAKIVGTEEQVVKSTDQKYSHYLTNINQLLGEVEGVLGVKTGWTENARENLVTYLKREDKTVLIAILGSQDRFEETKELIDWVFDNYTWEEVKYVSKTYQY